MFHPTHDILQNVFIIFQEDKKQHSSTNLAFHQLKVEIALKTP